MNPIYTHISTTNADIPKQHTINHNNLMCMHTCSVHTAHACRCTLQAHTRPTSNSFDLLHFGAVTTQEVISVALRLPLLLVCCRSVAAQEMMRYYYKNQHIPSTTHTCSLGVSITLQRSQLRPQPATMQHEY